MQYRSECTIKVPEPIVLVAFQQKKNASPCFWPTKARVAVLFIEFLTFEQHITSFQVPLEARAFNSTLSLQMKSILTFCYQKTPQEYEHRGVWLVPCREKLAAASHI
jgi:hypothetical protein